jgi:hypothetical protein
VRHIITFDERCPSVNSSYRSHWREQAAITRRWREWACLLATRKPPLTPPVVVHVQPHTKDNRLADAGNSFGVAKAIIDGFVDAGMLPGDGPKIVRALHLYAAVNVGTDQLLVDVEEVAEDA